MGIFGKILIILNLLAAGAFTYLAVTDWNIRQEWAFSALGHELRIKGFPVEGPDTLPSDPDDLVKFDFVGDNVRLSEIKKKTLKLLVPVGGEPFGGVEVANQTAEVKRVYVVLLSLIENDQDKKAAILRFLLPLSQTGTERDGLIALLRDIPGTARRAIARNDLAYLGRTPAQQSALSALVAIANLEALIRAGKKTEEYEAARILAQNALLSAVLADYPNSITIPPSGTKEARTTLQNEQLQAPLGPLKKLIEAAQAKNANQGELEALEVAVANTAADDRSREQLKRIARLASNLLDTPDKRRNALVPLGDIIRDRGTNESEKRALTEVIQIISDPSANISESAERAGRAWLAFRFEDALSETEKSPRPANLTGREIQQEPDKRTKIAHLLYHLDLGLDRNMNRSWDQRLQWQQRVASIVGIDAYVNAIDAQATRLAAISQRLEQLILNDQAVFETQYQELVRAAQYLAGILQTVNEQLNEEKALVAELGSDVKARTGERDDLRVMLKDAKADAKKSLAEFQVEQNKLIQLNKSLRDAQDALFVLERQIRELEAKIKGK
jgi:hypothetical protein